MRISVFMKRLNPETGKPFKRGDIREDNYVFKHYELTRIKQNGYFKEVWYNPIAYEAKVQRDNAWFRKYLSLNKSKYAAKRAKERAAKTKATPKWLTKQQLDDIAEFYMIAKMFQLYTGETYHVDHIEPINGEDVCGLHVPWNLRVIHWKENLEKSNKRIEI